MPELEISICTGDPATQLKTVIERYWQETRLGVRLTYIDWGEAWAAFRKMTLARRGPAISETGTTWMSSLSGRNDLRHFSINEARMIGGASAFPKSIWESCIDAATGDTIAIPWIVDTYIMFYRADIFEQAGINAGEAFRSLENFTAALEKIKAIGKISPLALPTANSLSSMHNISSWIWGMGGDYVDRSGKKLTLNTPQAREGIRMYYNLFNYIHADMRGLTDEQCEEMFLAGKAAVILRNPSLLHNLKTGQMQTQFREHIQTAVQPGMPLIGGSNLVIWAYSPPALERSAIDFIRHMVSIDSQMQYFETSGMIPARVEAIQRISADPDYAPVFQSLVSGRDLPYVRLWGLIEDNLASAFSNIWKTLIETPNADIDKVIENILGPVEFRLNNILSQ